MRADVVLDGTDLGPTVSGVMIVMRADQQQPSEVTHSLFGSRRMGT